LRTDLSCSDLVPERPSTWPRHAESNPGGERSPALRTALAVTVTMQMDFVTWLIVGLVAGLLASAVMRGSGYGVLGDIVVGIVGAFVGSWTFRELGWQAPFTGLAGVIAVAFCGAVLVLVAVRLVTSVTRRAA
jgi:uncharacterized membrane protein YeaQ/YmgE (transglycosylase-associated protein family)